MAQATTKAISVFVALILLSAVVIIAQGRAGGGEIGPAGEVVLAAPEVDTQQLGNVLHVHQVEKNKADEAWAIAHWNAELERQAAAKAQADRDRQAQLEREAAARAAAARGDRGGARSTEAPPIDAPVANPSSAANRDLGRDMAAGRGWTGDQWTCLDSLWGTYESGWDERRANYAGSGAYGIPQALPGSKMQSAATAEELERGETWRTSAAMQIRWGLGYIAGRYGTPCEALSARLAKGWY